MKHALFIFLRVLLLVIALYAVSNALKELLLREDELLDSTMLVLFNVLIAAVCWSLGCWKSQRAGREAPSSSFR
jgi:predicted Co/Zn/Cd cation transporter (cation efflux family)